MSRLLQALLGANVDGSGSSLHVERRASRDSRDDLTMVGAKGSKKIAETETFY